MNWTAVYVVLLFASVVCTVGALACMMTSFEFDRFPKPFWYVALVVAFVAADALLAGVVFA